MIRITKSVQVENYIYIKKNNKVDVLNRKNDYMCNKEIFNQNVLKINNDESLSLIKREFNIMLRIFCDD